MTVQDRPAFAARRRELIVELLRVHGTMALRDLADRLRVSEVTVRRDVRILEAQGVLDRRRGGASLPGHRGPRRDDAPTPELAAIARTAAALVTEGDAIVLGPGEAVAALAAELVRRTGLTVVTNFLRAARILAEAPGVEVVVTGGTLRGAELALVGGAAEQALEGLRVRRAFVSGHGVTAERGVSTANAAVAGVERALADCAEEVIVLADHTRIGVDAVVQTVAPEYIGHLVTDSNADPEVLLTLEDMGTTVHVAVPETDRGH